MHSLNMLFLIDFFRFFVHSIFLFYASGQRGNHMLPYRTSHFFEKIQKHDLLRVHLDFSDFWQIFYI